MTLFSRGILTMNCHLVVAVSFVGISGWNLSHHAVTAAHTFADDADATDDLLAGLDVTDARDLVAPSARPDDQVGR